MSEDPPQVPPPEAQGEEHEPPEIGVEEVPGVLGNSPPKSQEEHTETKEHAKRADRLARVIGKSALKGWDAFSARIVDRISFGKFGPMAEARKTQTSETENRPQVSEEITGTEQKQEPNEPLEESSEPSFGGIGDDSGGEKPPEEPLDNHKSNPGDHGAENPESMYDRARREYEEERAWREYHGDSSRAAKERTAFVQSLDKKDVLDIGRFDIPIEVAMSAKKKGIPIKTIAEAKYDSQLRKNLKDIHGIDVGVPEPEEVAADNGIPEHIVEAAKKHGISVEYLVHAMDNQAAGERLRKIGIKWGAQPPEKPEGQTALDPGVIILKQGMRHRERVSKTREELENALSTRLGSWGVRKDLKRIGGNLPQPKFVRKLLQRRVARKVYKNWVKDNEKQAKKDPTHLYDTGLLGFGADKKKEILKEIRDLDYDISVIRSKLTPLNSHKLKRFQYERHDLAEEIVRIQRKLDALRRGRLEPRDMYQHSKFKRVLKKYNNRTTTAQDPHKYDDFPMAGEEASEPHEVVGAESPRDRDATTV